MTPPDRDYDDVLSRVLHSTLDPVEPAGDGLAKIQQRIAEPWLKRRMSLLRTELTALAWLIVVRCEPLLDRARSGFAAATGTDRSPGAARRASGGATASAGRHQGAARRRRPADTGLRRWLPTLAVGGAVVLVVAGVFAFGQLRTDVGTATTRSSTNTPGSSNGQGSQQSGSRKTNGHATAFPSPGAGRQPASRTAGIKTNPGNLAPQTGTSAPSSPSPGSSPGSASPSPSPTSASPSPTSASPTASPTTSSEGADTSPSPIPDPGP